VFRSKKWAVGFVAAVVGVMTTSGATAEVVSSSTTVTTSLAGLQGSLADGVLALHSSRGATGAVVVDERSAARVGTLDSSAFTTDLATGDSAVYQVLEDNEVVARIIATRAREGSLVPDLVAITTSQGTTIDWASTPGVAGWTVDGTPVMSTDTTLDHALQDPEESIEIIGLAAQNGEYVNVVNGLLLTPPRPTSSAATASSRGDGSAMITDSGPVTSGNVVTVKRTEFVYENYIPYEYIDAPDGDLIPMDCESGDGSDYWYAGDDRGATYNHPRYRTVGRALYIWGDRRGTSETDVSPTKRYIRKDSGTFVYDSQRQESQDSVIMVAGTMDSTKAVGYARQSSGNPYCSKSNTIDYTQLHDMYRGGGYKVEGSHDRMPDHHAYIRRLYSDGTVGHGRVFYHPLKDPKCLNSTYEAMACPKWDYSYTG